MPDNKVLPEFFANLFIREKLKNLSDFTLQIFCNIYVI